MTNDTAQPNQRTPSPKGLHVALWIVQWLLGLTFAATGVWKVATPIPALAAMIPWAGEVSPSFLYMTAFFDFAGGVGIVLPSLTRIQPRVAVLAAIGCAALQASAIVFHVSRGEGASTPFNFFLVGLSLFVAWGRWAKAPITPR